MQNIIELLNKEESDTINYRFLSKGMVLFHENDYCNSIGILISGNISIVSYLNDGKEIIYNELKENQIFGNNLIFSSEPYYRGDILALSDSKIALIYYDDLINILQNNTSFMMEYLKIQANFSKNLNNRIKLLSIDSAMERFYFYLHNHRGQIEYKTISDLARNLYLKRETLSRLISRLEKQGKIIRTDKQIFLNE